MENTEFIRDNLQPVFLGNTSEARRLAARLYKKYRIVPYICDSKKSLLSRFALHYTLINVSQVDAEEQLCEELTYLVALDSVPVYVAVPFKREYSEFLKENRQRLESHYVFRNPHDILSNLPFINNENGGQGNDASFSS